MSGSMKNINDCTTEELNTLAAKAQGWIHLANQDWTMKDGDKFYCVSRYDPCHDGQQAMDLLREFQVDVHWVGGKVTAGFWHSDYARVDDTPEIAIVKAVIVSEFGEDIEDEAL
jgi:hypothetical protein